jgi:tetratricopeptide (TPR) repeat protein
VLRIRFAAVLALLCMATTCQKDYIDYANEYYDVEDWEKAAENYELALKRETADAVLAKIKERLAICRDKASAAHAQAARDHLAQKRYEEAIREAELARRWKLTDETAALLAQAKGAQAAHHRDVGKGHLAAGEFEKAIAALETAVRLDPSSENTGLLMEAKRRQKEAVAALAARAEEAFAQRRWNDAAKAYGEILSKGTDDEAARRRQFSELMADAEAKLATDRAAALRLLEEAARLGFHADHVALLRDENAPGDYEITFQEAVLLPFKPDSMLPWDGGGGKVAGAQDLLNILAKQEGEPAAKAARARWDISKVAPEGTAAPDCSLKVTVGDEAQESAVRTDEYSPTFNLVVKVKGATKKDRTPLRIVASDADDRGASEEVGAWTVELGEFLKGEAKRTRIFMKPDKTLEAGGIYAITLTVRKTR